MTAFAAPSAGNGPLFKFTPRPPRTGGDGVRLSHSAPFLHRWPLLALAILLVALLTASIALWAGTNPAGAQDGYQPD